jgi:hypothetical protein
MSRSIAVLVCPHLGQVFILKRGPRRQPRRQRSRARATFQDLRIFPSPVRFRVRFPHESLKSFIGSMETPRNAGLKPNNQQQATKHEHHTKMPEPRGQVLARGKGNSYMFIDPISYNRSLP